VQRTAVRGNDTKWMRTLIPDNREMSASQRAWDGVALSMLVLSCMRSGLDSTNFHDDYIGRITTYTEHVGSIQLQTNGHLAKHYCEESEGGRSNDLQYRRRKNEKSKSVLFVCEFGNTRVGDNNGMRTFYCQTQQYREFMLVSS